MPVNAPSSASVGIRENFFVLGTGAHSSDRGLPGRPYAPILSTAQKREGFRHDGIDRLPLSAPVFVINPIALIVTPEQPGPDEVGYRPTDITAPGMLSCTEK